MSGENQGNSEERPLLSPSASSPSTNKSHHTLYPAVLRDASTGGAGVIAGELAAEEESLHLVESEEVNYGAITTKSSKQSATSYAASSEATPVEQEFESGYGLPRAKLFTVISSLFMASFLAALDTTVVTTLLTVIASDLNAVASISWIATAYLLSCSAFQPLFGKLSDIFGRKILLILCCTFFAVGCMICAIESLTCIIVGRFVTGIGGSGLTTLGTITMSDLIPLRDRGLYQGLANVFFGLGAACGGIIGGFVADTLGWKYVFTLQVPLAIIVGLAIWWNLIESSPGSKVHGAEFRDKLKRVDFQGSIFLVSALMTILTAASLGGRQIAYNSASFIGLVIIAVALLGGFIYTEAYVSAEPIIPIELLTERTILSSSLTNWFYTMGVFTYLYYVPVYYTSVMGLSATENGQRLIPNFFGVSLGSVGAGIYMKRTGRYYNLTILVGIISIYGVWRILNINPEISLFKQYTLLLPSGLGYSCMLTVTLLSLIAAVPSKYQACTTSIQYTFRATGSTLGVSIGSAIFQNVLKNQLTKKISQVVSDDPILAQKIISRALESTDYVKHAPKVVQLAIRDSYGLACKGAFGFSLATVVLGYACSLFMKEHALHSNMNRD